MHKLVAHPRNAARARPSPGIAVSADLMLQAECAERLSDALLALPTGCDNVPTEWYWANAKRTCPPSSTSTA